MTELKVLLEFPGSHHYFQNYCKTDYYCPECGVQQVWEEQSAGDYYLGPSSYCTACFSCSYLSNTHKVSVSDVAYNNLVEQLKSGKPMTPSTRKGN